MPPKFDWTKYEVKGVYTKAPAAAVFVEKTKQLTMVEVMKKKEEAEKNEHRHQKQKENELEHAVIIVSDSE
jgi:hypothetical protein